MKYRGKFKNKKKACISSSNSEMCLFCLSLNFTIVVQCRHCTLSNRATSYSLSECNLLKNKEDHSSDDCLPFLLDDDSSGYDGSPSFNRRRPSMKSSHNLYFDSRKEAVSSTMRHVDHSSRQCNRTQRLLSRGFRIDDSTSNLHREQPSACMEKRPVSYHPRGTMGSHNVQKSSSNLTTYLGVI